MTGDILGLSDDNTGVKLPHPPSDGSVPEGIDVVEHRRHWGADELKRSDGVTGADMGAAGEGTDIAADHAGRGRETIPEK